MHFHHDHPENAPHYKSLNVNVGVSDVPTINPYRKPQKKKRKLAAEDYFQGILNQELSVLSQAVTLVESSLPEHQKTAQEVIEKCLPHSGNSIRVGITGVPGAGKSTFIEALGMHLINAGKKLAVLAIDPSSERTKGSILGDKTRMEELSIAKSAFIRPSPSAGSLGGVARKTRESIILCEAAGFDTIFVETVGVGQSETAVHSMVDFFLLIQLAGTGDELQGIKRGIMEMADGIAVNKSDGNNIERSNLAARQFKNALHLFPLEESGWSPDVVTCSAVEKNGISDVWEMITRYENFVKDNEFFYRHRNQQSKYWMYESINESLKADFYHNPTLIQLLQNLENQVLHKELSSFMAAKKAIDSFKALR